MPKEINSDLLRGNINTIILSALYSGDRYGYDIVNEIEKKSHGQLTIKQPTLYSCLKRLESQGYVTSYWGEQSNGGRRKYFSLTELGKEVFKQSQDDYEYSRTVIDKLISESKYYLGEDEPVSDTHDIQAEKTVDTTVMDVSPTGNDDSEQIVVASTKDSEQLSLSDIDTSYAQPVEFENNDNVGEFSDARILTDEERIIIPAEKEENDEGFIPYNSQSFGASAPEPQTKEISWFDAGVVGNDGSSNSSASSNQEDINDIFERNFVESSYLDDLKTETTKSGDTPSMNFTNEFSDLIYDNTAPKHQYTPDYSESDYPYADSSDSASALIEAELSPLKKDDKNEFISYHDQEAVSSVTATVENEMQQQNSTTTGSYQDLLSGIIDKFEATSNNITKADIENNALELNDKVQIRTFGNIVESARELGEEVVVRTNDNKSKHQYAVKYFYKDNLLRLVTGGILFVVMLLETLFTYMICKNAAHCNGRFDIYLFVIAIAVSLFVPVYAVVKFYLNPDSKMRIENGTRENIWFKLVVMALICLLSFGLNLFVGMPLNGEITNYLFSLFLPIILSVNLPLSSLLFKVLYTKNFFIAKD